MSGCRTSSMVALSHRHRPRHSTTVALPEVGSHCRPSLERPCTSSRLLQSQSCGCMPHMLPVTCLNLPEDHACLQQKAVKCSANATNALEPTTQLEWRAVATGTSWRHLYASCTATKRMRRGRGCLLQHGRSSAYRPLSPASARHLQSCRQTGPQEARCTSAPSQVSSWEVHTPCHASPRLTGGCRHLEPEGKAQQ